MQERSVRLTLALTEADQKLIEAAATRMGDSPAEYARYAALRMAAQDATLDGPGRSRVDDDSTASLSRRSLRPTTHRATMPTIEMVRQLNTHLGAQLLAITLGADPDQVKRWASEESAPSLIHERRLSEAHEAWQLVVSVESPDMARAWWMGMKDGLDDLSPAEAIAQDRSRDVMAVARYFLEAG